MRRRGLSHKGRLLLAASLFFFAIPLAVLQAQMPEKDVRAELERAEKGDANDVRRELPALLKKYPDDAGVRYLEARLTEDGAQAFGRYEEIVTKYPASAWADDALYRMYQYEYANGLYKKADSVMARLRAEYPRSPFAQSALAPGSSPSSREAGKESSSAARASSPVPQKKPQQGAQAGAKTKTTGGGYDVQAGLFSTEALARASSERLSSLTGRQAHVRPRTSLGQTVYLVIFEGFTSAESARRFSQDLRTRHAVDSFVSPR